MRLSFAELQLKKDNMEAELKALSGVLDSVSCGRLPVMVPHSTNGSQHRVNMDTPLLTPDGFPRADIDVPQSTSSMFCNCSRCQTD